MSNERLVNRVRKLADTAKTETGAVMMATWRCQRQQKVVDAVCDLLASKDVSGTDGLAIAIQLLTMNCAVMTGGNSANLVVDVFTALVADLQVADAIVAEEGL